MAIKRRPARRKVTKRRGVTTNTHGQPEAATACASASRPTTCRYLARPVREQAAVRIFCLPYAGAGAARYFRWGEHLGPDVDLCPVLLPGREARASEPAFCDLQALVRDLAAALHSACNGPFCLFGHSMGALIAFELSRHLRRAFAVTPVRLFVSGHRAPHLRSRDPALHTLSDADLVEIARDRDGVPRAVFDHDEYVRLLLPTLRADFQLCETYRYVDEAPLDCPISVFGGLDDRNTPAHDIVAWRQHTTASCAIRFFPGGHLFINDSAAVVAAGIAADVEAVMAGRC